MVKSVIETLALVVKAAELIAKAVKFVSGIVKARRLAKKS